MNPMVPFWIAFGAAGLAAYPVYRTLIRTNTRQTVSEFAPESHQKKQGTPTMGGLIVVIGLLVALAYPSDSAWISWLVLVVGMAAIGFLDDWVVPRRWPGKRGLGWKQKLAMQVVVAVPAAYLFPLTRQDPLHVGLFALAVLFTANAYNFVDGLDGLAGSIGLLLALGLGSLAAGSSMTAVMAGALVPFLVLNAPPAKVFMGDVGSLPIGAVLGGLGYASAVLAGDASGVVAVVVLALVLIIELVPVPLQIFWVKVFKKRLFPYTPIHHAFEKAGWPESRVVWLFAIAQAVCVAGAWTLGWRTV